MKKYNVAIVGATGAVGEVMLEMLSARGFPVKEVYVLASERSEGKKVMFGSKPLSVTNLASFDFKDADIGLFSAGGDISAEYAPKAAASNCIVIDNTSHFRYENDVPLIIPEVNCCKIKDYKNRNIIANPNCSTIQMLVALKPIYDAVGIKRITVSTYQAVSGSGSGAVNELAKQTAELLNGRKAECEVYPTQIAFNVLPHIDKFLDNGYTKEEMKMNWETVKIFGDQDIKVSATCVRVPVFYGHSEAVQIETSEHISEDDARESLRSANGVSIMYER